MRLNRTGYISLAAGTVAAALAVQAAAAAQPAPPEGPGIPFDGESAYRVEAASIPSDGKHLSVSAWVRFDAVDQPQVIMNRGRANNLFTFYLFRDRIRMLIGHQPDAYTHANVPAPVPGRWVHYAGTYDGATISLYQNGTLAHTARAGGEMSVSTDPLYIGSLNERERFLTGALSDVCLWDRTLSADEVASVAAGAFTESIASGLAGRWSARSVKDDSLTSQAPGSLVAEKIDMAGLLFNEQADGFRGIWYFNQPSGDEYVYKYSGGLGTYCAKHIPMAWYAPAVNKTFFCYGGTDERNSTLLHMVSYYDHATGKLARPTLLLDKKTTDAHDNPVLNLDDEGYIWIFSSSHGKARPSYISRSVRPYDISEFELKWTGNFSYPQPCYMPGRGFLFMHTWYEGGRSLYCMTSSDGVAWSERQLFARIDLGHYQVSFPWKNRIGSAFNMHPAPKGLNWRSNLYYMQSGDFGETWQNVQGSDLGTPLTAKHNPALVVDYEAKGLNVYMKDLNYDSKGNPVILFVTSKGYESGPENMPRTWTTAHWNGTEWDIQGQIVSDNNYDTGCIHIESDTQWRIIGPTEVGPQPYNPGGEIAMWLSEDAGHSWRKVRQMTADSEFNHTYVRRPVNARPEFYGMWADGHGRMPSESRLYFCNRDGDVFRMPMSVDSDLVDPDRMPRP